MRKPRANNAEMEPMQPKRPPSAYVFFVTEHSAVLRKEKGFSVTEAMKGCGQAWNTIQDADKKKYEDLAALDQKRYQRQQDELKQKGFFFLDDGSKNTEHMVRVKKTAAASKPPKTRERATQTEKVTFADDLDYRQALLLARSLAPDHMGAKSTTAQKTPRQSSPDKAKKKASVTIKNSHNTSPSKTKKPNVSPSRK